MDDERLATLRRSVIGALDESRAAAQVYDQRGRLQWVSDQMLELAGATGASADEIGYGLALPEGVELPLWRAMLPESGRATLRADFAHRIAPAHGDGDGDDGDGDPVWVSPLDLEMGQRRSVGMLGLVLRAADGSRAGAALVFAPLLPARVLALVSEGDEGMFTRMADLAVPGRRPTAVVFADLDGSGPLSRRLPTSAYFDLVRRFTTTFDDLVAAHGGIVGKHAGDGASAFFLADGDGESAAASAALAVALSLPGALHGVVEDLVATGIALDTDDCRVNLGVHWGANLFIGQIVTGGRLEVTALGDEVTECARLEHVATGGQILASKVLVERVGPDDARMLRIDPTTLAYRPLAELAADDAKAVRDAGTLAVVDLTAARDDLRPTSAP